MVQKTTKGTFNQQVKGPMKLGNFIYNPEAEKKTPAYISFSFNGNLNTPDMHQTNPESTIEETCSDIMLYPSEIIPPQVLTEKHIARKTTSSFWVHYERSHPR